MRLHRFYISSKIEGETLVLKDERLINQWRNVFRYNVGSEVILFDGSGMEFDAVLEKLGSREIELRIVAKRNGIIPKNKIILYQSIIKKDKMEWVVEKATELGVSKIIPILSERSEKKGFNMDRVVKIAVEASEQCGRANVPVIESSQSLVDSLQSCEGEIIVFDSSGTTSPPAPLLAKERGDTPLSIFIGPEGGWSPKEIEKFKDLNIKIFSLGELTLRAETAAIVALTTSKLLDSRA